VGQTYTGFMTGDGPTSNDPFGDVPLFREIQRVLAASSGPVNWELARQVAIATASFSQEEPPLIDDDQRGLRDTVRAAELAVTDLTVLPMPSTLADVRAVRRGAWVEATIRDLRDLIDPVAARLGSAMGQMASGAMPGELPKPPGLPLGFQPPSALERSTPGEEERDGGQAEAIGQMMGLLGPLLMGTQVGTALGALGQEAFGCYDLAVPRPGPELLFVVPNISRFEHDWSIPSMEFRLHVSLHEVMHRLEFAGAWVRPHVLELVRDLVAHAEPDLSGIRQAMEGLDLSDPEALTETLGGMGNLFGDASDPEQRLRVARLRAFVVTAEGHAEHITGVLGRRMLPSFDRIEEALARHREDRAADQTLERLLGIEVTPAQHRLGVAFADAVVAATDEATLSRMWGSADSLPSMPELEEPTLWLSRTV
jgi:putative hydrolase